jgi:hypothetical protein
MKRLRRVIYTPTNLNQNLLYRLQNNDNTLIRIIFSCRNLGNTGVTTLMSALEGNTHLSALDLSSNRIETEGALSIASLLMYQGQSDNCNSSSNSNSNMSAITNNKSIDNASSSRGIRTLILGDNNLLDDGVNAIAYALETNQLLESLMLDDNCIGARGLAVLADSLRKNYKLERLHLKHNSFQSLSPLIACLFNKTSLEHVVDSNHSLKHIFLDCGYSYESSELEALLKINRLGRVEARRTKVALYLEEDLGRLFEIDVDARLYPDIIGILAQSGLNGVFGIVKNLPAAIFAQRDRDGCGLCEEDCMEVEYL